MIVDVRDRQRSVRVGARGLGAFLRRAARALPGGGGDEVSVELVGDARMRRLNREWRGIDRTTDVLSFPGGEPAAPDAPRSLGDIVISVPVAARQAAAAGHSTGRELRILALHGYLHLLGYDHERDDGRMMRLQRRLERRLLDAAGGSGR